MTSEKDHAIDALKAGMVKLRAEIALQNEAMKQLKCANQQLQHKLKQSEKDFHAVVAALCERDRGVGFTKRSEVKHDVLHNLLVKNKHAEQVAECLRKELDTVKFNAKTLRLQELQVECCEHFSEIVFLREKVATLLNSTQWSSSVEHDDRDPTGCRRAASFYVATSPAIELSNNTRNLHDSRPSVDKLKPSGSSSNDGDSKGDTAQTS
ncbi:hypothetical protein H310_03792 [Aphanomyces invadans]|uniref:Uncharacterized protein n=1 Tax=Aphanomyces invadans TaxID=157072 RepID=A0A024UE76_9STRA|nr:hypothetical protein H310_03792 [Aphanomyces invadans]ETW04579.1 hypothetical protein H310_03792 [Aphanomyces invadans]|eukprot:XP_008866017.1 hypothetical protein H310_03792 [Aphanomyces invadans]